ncbi:MAG: GNAT family N-acetyltransferase [Chitinophagaceae bacterium]
MFPQTIQIRSARPGDYKLLSDIGTRTLWQSHGHSAPETDMRSYIEQSFNPVRAREELENPAFIYHFLYLDEQPAGYSKIILDQAHPNITLPGVTKLERLYLLQEFLSRKAGQALLDFNIGLSKDRGQSGMWLFVWVENTRAIQFYKRNRFKIIGSHDFRITETRSNPNHQMMLVY